MLFNDSEQIVCIRDSLNGIIWY